MAGFRQELGISELNDNEIPSIKDSTAAGNSYANTQRGNKWGTSLNFKDNAYRFQKKYICLTFLIDRDNYGDYQNARKGRLTIKGTKKTIIINYYDKFGERNEDGELMNLTKCDDLFSHKDAVVRATVRTEKLFEIGEILEVQCTFFYSLISDKELNGTINLNQATIYSEVYWYYGGKKITVDLDYIQKNQGYNSKRFCPWSDYSGTIKIVSKTRTTNKFEENYFTNNKGKISIQVGTDMTFLHQRRMPTAIIFYGIKEDNAEHSVTIKIDDPQSFQSYIYEFNSEKLSDFKKINKAYVYFGIDNSNTILVHNFGNFLNCDISENFLLSFNKEDNINNYFVSFSDQNTDREVSLRSCLKGTIVFPSNLFEIQENGIYLNQTGHSKEIQGTIEGTVLRLNHDQIYVCSEQTNETGLSLSLSERPFSIGTYKLECYVLHRLKTEEEIKGNYIFEVENLKIDQIEKFVAFSNSKPVIKYSANNKTYEIPGIIIIPDEFLEIPSIQSEEFFIYDLRDGTRKSIDTYYLGFDLNRKQEIDLNSKVAIISYEQLKELYLQGEEKDETLDVNIQYYFKLNGMNGASSNIYTYSFPYTIGRISNPQYTSRKEEQDGIFYYLQDNGGDIKNKTFNDNGKTQNDFLRLRKDGEYFSLSRKPQEGKTAQEKLCLTFEDESKKKIPINIEVNSSNIKILLDYLKTFQSNKITFQEILGIMSDQELGDLCAKLEISIQADPTEIENKLGTFLQSGKITLTIQLFYICGKEETYDRELFKIILEELVFYPDIMPLGLRKKGVIINPGEEEDLVPTEGKNGELRDNAFVINVKNTKATTTDGVTSYTPINGCRIVFDTGEQGAIKPFFEIYLDEEGKIHLSNCIIDS